MNLTADTMRNLFYSFNAYLQKGLGGGWTDWTKADGVSTLGTVGQALRIEAIQFR